MLRKLLKLLLAKGKPAKRQRSDETYVSDWITWSPSDYSSAPEGFVAMKGASKLAVAGTNFRLDECLTVLSALKGGRSDRASVILVRETDNVADTNAIRVLVQLNHREAHIGYLPRDMSDKIAEEFSSDMPLKAALREWGKKKTNDAVFFRLVVFVPSAKDRRKFLRKVAPH